MSSVFIVREIEGDGYDILEENRLKIFSSKDKAKAYMIKRVSELDYDFEHLSEITEDILDEYDVFDNDGQPSGYDAYDAYVARVPYHCADYAIYGVEYTVDEEEEHERNE